MQYVFLGALVVVIAAANVQYYRWRRTASQAEIDRISDERDW